MRRKFLVLALALIIPGIVLAVVPGTEGKRFPGDDFAAQGGWQFSSPLVLQEGHQFILKWEGPWFAQVAILTLDEAERHLRTPHLPPKTVAEGTARGSSIAVTIPAEALYVLGVRFIPSGDPWYFRYELLAVVPFAYAAEGLAIMFIGLILLAPALLMPPGRPWPRLPIFRTSRPGTRPVGGPQSPQLPSFAAVAPVNPPPPVPAAAFANPPLRARSLSELVAPADEFCARCGRLLPTSGASCPFCDAPHHPEIRPPGHT
jgi:hypothetical protein